MSYTAALKMPSSYAAMNEEEMVYLEGGRIKWEKESSGIGYYISYCFFYC